MVGIFLEGGTAEMQAAMPKIVRMKPRVSSLEKLRKVTMEEFLKVSEIVRPATRLLLAVVGDGWRSICETLGWCGLCMYVPMHQNPNMLQPPQFGPGEFLAEKDEVVILDVLKKHSDNKVDPVEATVSTDALPTVMKELGANWTEPEVQEVIKVLDCDRKVHTSLFALLPYLPMVPHLLVLPLITQLCTVLALPPVVAAIAGCCPPQQLRQVVEVLSSTPHRRNQ